jgi:hypothetical protein
VVVGSRGDPKIRIRAIAIVKAVKTSAVDDGGEASCAAIRTIYPTNMTAISAGWTAIRTIGKTTVPDTRITSRATVLCKRVVTGSNET